MASGSSAAIAAGSLLTEMIKGRHWRRAAALSATSLMERLGPARSGTLLKSINVSSSFAIEALHRALGDSIRQGTFPVAGGIREEAVLVAMSGGVDSSAACLLEKQAGGDVIGVTMRLWSEPGEGAGAARGCCSLEAVLDARETCHRLGLPHLTVDFSDAFLKEVVDDFSRHYLEGRTPNPCVRCNGRLRFPALLKLAGRLGAARVATGHYARIVRKDGRPLLARGADPGKDQSYMLWGIGPEHLKKLSFPLGEMRKPRVRALARNARLPASGRPESQDICFIPDGDYRRFIRSRAKAGRAALPGRGDIVDINGNKIGTHGGYHDYTVGQRRGLGGGARDALYVIKTVPEQNLVVAGHRDELAVRSIEISDVNSFAAVEEGQQLLLQMRYNSPAEPARVSPGARIWKADLKKPGYGVAPGQSAVFYKSEVVVAGGVISATLS